MKTKITTEPIEHKAPGLDPIANEAARLVATRMSRRDQQALIAAAQAEELLGIEPGALMTPTIATLGIEAADPETAANTILQGFDDLPAPTPEQIAALGSLLTEMEAA